jgi:hypothetical protein
MLRVPVYQQFSKYVEKEITNKWLILVLHIQEVPGSSEGLETSCSDCSLLENYAGNI